MLQHLVYKTEDSAEGYCMLYYSDEQHSETQMDKKDINAHWPESGNIPGSVIVGSHDQSILTS